MKICNAFSLNMLPRGARTVVRVRPLSLDEARASSVGAASAVGHAPTAALFAVLLGRDVAHARSTLQLEAGDRLLVGQYRGPRLEEGTIRLPEGAEVDWMLVEIEIALPEH